MFILFFVPAVGKGQMKWHLTIMELSYFDVFWSKAGKARLYTRHWMLKNGCVKASET